MLHIKIVLREYMNIMSEKQKRIQLKFLKKKQTENRIMKINQTE